MEARCVLSDSIAAEEIDPTGTRVRLNELSASSIQGTPSLAGAPALSCAAPQCDAYAQNTGLLHRVRVYPIYNTVTAARACLRQPPLNCCW